MTSVRIWTLESDYDAKAVRYLAEKLVLYFQLGNISIRASGKSAIPRRTRMDAPMSDHLRLATQNYLKEDACVIFVIDQDSPMSLHQRRQEPNSLINQIEAIIKERSLTGKVFLALAVQEVEAWLLIDCLGITCCFISECGASNESGREKILKRPSFAKLVDEFQLDNTENIVEKEIGGRGAKEWVIKFSQAILRELNPDIRPMDVYRRRYRPAMSPKIAEHVVVDAQTLRRNNSLCELGEMLAQFN